MKTTKQLMIFTCSFIIMLFSFNAIAQNPTFLCRIENATQVSCNVYEFDVVMQRTGTTTLRLAMFQLGIKVNPAIIPMGATCNVAMVPGSASALNALMRPNESKFYFENVYENIQVAPMPPQGWTNSTVISNLITGTKLCRIRVACSQAWNTGASTNHTWSFTFTNSFATKIFAYTGLTAPGLNTDITSTGTFSVSASPSGNIITTNIGFADPIAQTVTADNTQVCSLAGNGATISLSNTQYGYSYYLYRNDTLQNGAGTIAFGTDSAVTFGALQTKGVITVKSAGCSGLINMSNSITLTQVQPVVPSVILNLPPNYFICLSTEDSINLIATPVNGGTSPTYQWYVNNVPVANNSTYTFVADTIYTQYSIYCEMYSSESCVTTSVSTSSTAYINVIPPRPLLFYVSGGDTICPGDTTQVTLSSSELGVTYWLSQSPYAPCFPPFYGCMRSLSGTGMPLVWDVTDAGVYYVVVNPSPCDELPHMDAMPGYAEVVFKSPISPSFTQQGPYLQGSGSFALPTTSDNGITGTWSPAVVNTATLGTTLHTFTPNAGQCAGPTTMSVTVASAIFTHDIGTTVLGYWNVVSGAGVYEFAYRPYGSTGAWIGRSSPVNYAKVTNLTPGGHYEYRIKAYSPSGAPIGVAKTGDFTTTVVAFDSAYDIGTTNYISWPDFSPWASSYVLQYKKASDPGWQSSMAYLPETKLINLTPETSYQCRLVVYKGGSLWGTAQAESFTTGKTVFTVNNNTGTSLDLFCTDYSPWATSYGFNYKPQSASSWINNSASSNPTIHLTGLTPNTVYNCRVYIYKGNFWGISQQGSFNTTIIKSTLATNTNTGINIFPNPFSNEVNMDVFTEQETQVTWRIYDMIGQEVMRGNEKIPGGYSTLNIDASALPKGIYLLNAILNEESKSFKLLKE